MELAGIFFSASSQWSALSESSDGSECLPWLNGTPSVSVARYVFASCSSYEGPCCLNSPSLYDSPFLRLRSTRTGKPHHFTFSCTPL
ncbi:hypothetical protein BV25DRAFT_1026428 [Artomyces pyxidatus]|uniref:Uncharacterized protein n=1 Tax=Artomyces pyxidatus TaxID=48021 RepID=A0ACB8SVW1_9AGAM|nr:hypothetical protein BV25DRAFT_1026428 [Artomyces pyxidatus]